MPAVLLSIVLILTLWLTMVSMVGGFIASWGWAIWRWRQRKPLIPVLAEPPRVPWGLGSVALVVLTWLAVNLTVVLAYTQLTQSLPLAVAKPEKGADAAIAAPSLSFTEQMVIVSLINLALLVAIPALLHLASRARLSDLGLFRRHLPRQLLIGAMAFFLISPFVYAVNALAVLIWKPEGHPIEKMLRNELSMGIAELAILSAVILAPMTEELIFRGVIQRWLCRVFTPDRADVLTFEEVTSTTREPEIAFEPIVEATLPLNADRDLAPDPDPVAAQAENPYLPPSSPIGTLDSPAHAQAPSRLPYQPIVMTSVLFAAVHYPQWPAPLGIFLLSLGLGCVAQRSGSLVAAMVMHALFNGLGTLILILVIQLGSLGLVKDKEAGKPQPSCIAPTHLIKAAKFLNYSNQQAF